MPAKSCNASCIPEATLLICRPAPMRTNAGALWKRFSNTRRSPIRTARRCSTPARRRTCGSQPSFATIVRIFVGCARKHPEIIGCGYRLQRNGGCVSMQVILPPKGTEC